MFNGYFSLLCSLFTKSLIIIAIIAIFIFIIYKIKDIKRRKAFVKKCEEWFKENNDYN